MSARVGWLTAIPAAAGYAVLWIGYASGWEWIAACDAGALLAAHRFGADRSGWIGFWVGVSALLGPTALRVLAAVGIVVAWRRGRRRTALFLALTVLAMGMVTVVAKALADRPRPDTALTVAASSSFPSGHALGSVAGVLAFLAVLVPRLSAPARVWAVIAGAGAVLLVGAARVVLNVHHPSDVLAGWLLGYLWFLLCVRIVRPDRAGPDRPPGPR